MKKYTYCFNDGTNSTIDVTDEMYEILTSMDEDERKQNYNYNRHNVLLSALDYESESFTDKNEDILQGIIETEDLSVLRTTLKTLPNNQRELIEKVFFEKRTVVSIAREEGVSDAAIFCRLHKIYKQLRKFFE